MLWCLRLIGVGIGRFDGINRNYWQREQFAVLAIDHPFAVAQRRQISREGSRICQRSVLAEELEFPGAMSGGELLQDQPAEQARENTHVEEKVGSAGDPARTIERDAATRNDHMDMRMVVERRAPGVEDREQPDAGAEVLGIGCYG